MSMYNGVSCALASDGRGVSELISCVTNVFHSLPYLQSSSPNGLWLASPTTILRGRSFCNVSHFGRHLSLQTETHMFLFSVISSFAAPAAEGAVALSVSV